jgi:hypothetical protein
MSHVQIHSIIEAHDISVAEPAEEREKTAEKVVA